MIKHSIAVCALCGMISLGLTGCGRDDSAAVRPANAPARNESPDVLVRNAVESRTELASMAGKGVMRIVDQPAKFGLTVNADVVADAGENRRLRIKADKLAGSIQAFDVAMLGDDIGFYIPTEKTLYYGKVNDLGNFSFNFDPDEIMRQMMSGDATLTSRNWRHVRPGPADPKSAIVLEEADMRGRPHMRLALNPRNGMIYTITNLDSSGEPVFVKKFDDYRNLAKSDGNAFPYLISFIWPQDRRSMEMQFKQVDGNAEISDGDFDIAASEDTRYLPLNAAEAGNDPVASAPQAPADAERM